MGKRAKQRILFVIIFLFVMYIFYFYRVGTSTSQISRLTGRLRENSGLNDPSRDKLRLAETPGDRSRLTESLRDKVQRVSQSNRIAENLFQQSCQDQNITQSWDNNRSLNKHLPADLAERVHSLVFLKNMVLPAEVASVMEEMRAKIRGQYDVIIVHATSDNHYGETEALMRSLHKVVFPALKNFTFIFYDLGLKPEQKQQLEKHCRCTVLDFPFSKLPQHFRSLNCFAWKVLIIAAHFNQAQVIVWTDSSIRFKNGSDIITMVHKTEQLGVQQLLDSHPGIIHTLTSMYEAFGDSPCAHGRYINQCQAGFGMYHNEPLIWHAVILPWLTCAANKSCICPVPVNQVLSCGGNHAPDSIARCHRSDQSAITIILAKLFREYYYQFSGGLNRIIEIKRGDTASDYFSSWKA